MRNKTVECHTVWHLIEVHTYFGAKYLREENSLVSMEIENIKVKETENKYLIVLKHPRLQQHLAFCLIVFIINSTTQILLEYFQSNLNIFKMFNQI